MQVLDIANSVERLKNGGTLLYPTETFYGIGCKVSSDSAIASVFQAKRRLLAMPLPVIVATAAQLDMIAHISHKIKGDIEKLEQNFWPGPLTILVPARVTLSPLLTGGTGNVAARVSSHVVPQKLASLLGEPIVSSSANISGQPAQTDWRQIPSELLNAVGAVIEEGDAPQGGLASTIVEPLGDGDIKLHRTGVIAQERLIQLGFHVVA